MSNIDAAAASRSLLAGVEEAVCSALGIRKLRHRSALLALRLPDHVDLADLVFGVISDNWIAGRAAENMTRSRQNWRWSLQTYIGEANRSPEVMLERAVAAACEAAGSSDWANQIPVASGLIAGARDNRRAIDLVHRRDTRTYEMIELKITSDTPLYAAVELLGYASLWLLARRDTPSEHRTELLDAEQIDLRVLAPAAYYARYNLDALQKSVDAGITSLSSRYGVTMTFEFDVLSDQLVAPILPNQKIILDDFLNWRTFANPIAN